MRNSGWLRLGLCLAVAGLVGYSTVRAEDAGPDAPGGDAPAGGAQNPGGGTNGNGGGRRNRGGGGGAGGGGFGRNRAPAETADTLPADTDKASEALTSEAALPDTVKADQTAAIKAKPIGFNMQDDTVALWQATAKDTDITRANFQGYNAAGLESKGILILQVPTPAATDAATATPAATPATGAGAGGRGNWTPPAPSDALMEKAKVLTLAETADVDALAAAAKDAKAKKKLFAAQPSNALLTSWGDAKTGDVAKNCDYVLLSVQKWLDDDKTEGKTEFLDKVAKYTAAIRKANDKCKIFLEFGARDQGSTTGGGTAEAWVLAVAKVNAKDAKCFDGVYITPSRTFGGGRGGATPAAGGAAGAAPAAPDPAKTGVNALKQFLAWVRGKA